ncbi:MAG: FAD-binding oxidoreductase [Rhodothermia bacterium]|nr:FAD-binding oxidoreductase [Rhodothermia bacterium]
MTSANLSFWQHLNREFPLEYDVAVVGGGIAGCSAAYWLKSMEPSAQLILLEKDEIGSGATGRNAGFLLQGSSTSYTIDIERYGRDVARRLWQATLDNRNLVEELFGGEDIAISGCGSSTAAGTDEEADRLMASAQLLHEDGFDAEYLDSRDINKLLGSVGYRGGLHVPSGAVADPVRLVRAVLRHSGAEVLEKTAVKSVSGGNGNTVDLATTRGLVRAGSVVIAINAYLPLLEPEMIELVRPVRAQMLSTVPIGETSLPMPVYSHDGYYYVRQREDGRVLAGGARHLHEMEEVGYSLDTTSALQNDLGIYLSQHFPQWSDARVEHRWAGTMGFSPDGLPSWGRVPDVAGAFWVAGFTGHGMSIAFLIGRVMADLVLGSDQSDLGRIFDSGRFTAK